MLIPAKGFATPAEHLCDEIYCKAEPRLQQVSNLFSQGTLCSAHLQRLEQWQLCPNREQLPSMTGAARQYKMML